LNKFKKILSLGYDLTKFFILLNEHSTEIESFNNERLLIKLIGRIGVKNGTLVNIHEGGYGRDTISTHPNREEIIQKSKFPSKKGKTYEEIYGETAAKEKEKRKLAGMGKKYPRERIENSARALKGNIPWNKGLHGDPRVRNKYSKNLEVNK